MCSFPRKPTGLVGKNWRDFKLKQKMGHEKWRPDKRLTWYQIDHLKTLKKLQPEEWSNHKLSRQFGISIPAVVRILQSKFDPPTEVKERQDRKSREQTNQRQALFKKTLFSEDKKTQLSEEKKTQFSEEKRTED